jgi:hypothetical protein
MPFHRLTDPAYFGGLPGTHDFINNFGGTPSPADGAKVGGTYAGTYFIAFGEAATTSNSNRANKALAENTDFLDDIVHRDLAVPTIKSVVLSSPTDEFVLPGDIFVGLPGTSDDAYNRANLVVVYSSVGGFGYRENPTGNFTPISVDGIEDTLGATVIGDPGTTTPPGDGDGFYTNPTIKLNLTLNPTTLKVACYVRSNVKEQPVGMNTRLDSGYEGLNEVYARTLNNAWFYPSSPVNWKDGETNPAALMDDQISKIISDLGVDVDGSNRINSQEYVGSSLTLTDDVSIYTQLTEIVDFLDAPVFPTNPEVPDDIAFSSPQSRTTIFHAVEFESCEDGGVAWAAHPTAFGATHPYRKKILGGIGNGWANLYLNGKIPNGAIIRYVEFVVDEQSGATPMAGIIYNFAMDWGTPGLGVPTWTLELTPGSSTGLRVLRVPAVGTVSLTLSDALFVWLQMTQGTDNTSRFYAARVHWDQPSISYP